MLLRISVFISMLLFAGTVLAQGQINPGTPIGGQSGNSQRPIITAVPFLGIAPDARSAGMGDVGAAISPDVNAIHWNPSKLAFAQQDIGVAFSLTPWLQKIVGDMNLYYLSAYKKVNKNSAAAVSMRYFDLGDMQFTDENRVIIQEFNPREFSFDASYAMKLSNTFSMAVTGRFLHSNLSGHITNSSTNTDTRAANSVSADVSAFYTNDLLLGGYNSTLSFGANLSNMGPKVTYSNENERDFIPTTLRLGTALTTEFDPYNKLTFAVDVSKLLVPSPAVYDSSGQNIVAGPDPAQGWVAGMFGSFADAPDGMSEEMKELMLAAGVEYWYNDMVALRGGYFHENQDKGNRKYFTLGLGLRYQVFGIDFAYLIATQQNHPLEDTLRFTLLFKLDGKSNEPQVNNQ